jgi:hypothetical protein
MKKLSVFFLFAAVFVFFSFSFVIFAQDESKKPDNSKAELQERMKALDAEKKAIIALKDEYAKRSAGYDTKCKGKSFDLNKKDEKQIANECKEESEWLISSPKSLKERQQKYNEDLAQYKLDMNALQKATDEQQERVKALDAEKKAINALKDEYAKRKANYDTKCMKDFRLETEDEKQIYKECQEEREWLISSQKSLQEKQQKFNEDLAQYKLDMNALQKAPDTTQGK